MPFMTLKNGWLHCQKDKGFLVLFFFSSTVTTSIIFSVFSFIIQVVLIVQNFLPTDPFGGLLDIAKEPFFAYMPYVNYFVPVGFCVALVSAFVSAYATYVIFKYFKKIISSVLEVNLY